MNDLCPPWHAEAAMRLVERHRAGRLPHAMLFTGPPGVGKRDFATWLSARVCCSAALDLAVCDICPACRRRLAGSETDRLDIGPEGAAGMITVDAIRRLVAWMPLTARQGAYRLVVIDSAERMNRSAANSLLKTLEEPSDQALIILVSDRPGALPATVRSRCQVVALRPSRSDVAVRWLQARMKDSDTAVTETEAKLWLDRARGAPLRAMTMASDEAEQQRQLICKAWEDLLLHRASVGRIVETLSGQPTAVVLELCLRLCADTLRYRHGVSRGVDAALMPTVDATADRLTSADWFAVRDRLSRLVRIDSTSFRLANVLEGLFAEMRGRCVAP